MQETLKQAATNQRITGIVRRINYFSTYAKEDPMVKVVECANTKLPAALRNYSGLFCVFMSPLENREGIISFFAPGQMDHIQYKTVASQLTGRALVFHPGVIAGTVLANDIGEYSFFNCESTRTLHLSRHEYQIVLDCFSNISTELNDTPDEHSKRLIISNIELCLNYCERFYNRKAMYPVQDNSGVLSSLDKSLTRYFSSEQPLAYGVPSVSYCAAELHLSTNYFGNLVKKEAGKTALEYIHEKMVEEAKYRICTRNKTINEIAYELGFKYPQHFSRLFKKVAGQSPTDYKRLNLK